MSNARLELAEAFLREAVYRSRERQAASVALSRAKTTTATGTCGLGEKAAVDLDLTPRGKQIAAQLWPAGLEGDDLERVRRVLGEWVVKQDALDRQRNHHMKAVRLAHGFERDNYPPKVAQEFDAGLLRVNTEETTRRRGAASELLGDS